MYQLATSKSPSKRQITESMHVEHLRVPIGSGALHAERLGRGGPPVVLLHGFGTCAFLWRRLAPALAMAGHTAIAVDLLGHGESDRPADASYGLAAQAEYLARALAALRLPPCTVVGQDIGALVALRLAAMPRNHVERVVLISPPDPDDLPGPDIRTLQRSSARIALNANTLFGAKPALTPLLHAGVTAAERMPDLLVARYLAPFVGSDGLSQLLMRAAAVELSEDARAMLSRASCPTLVVEGDGGSPRPSLSWPALLRSSDVTVTRLPGVSWLIPEDAPERLSELLLNWIASQRKP
jgi:pimeloyl-ACP methyl ester carboxylesterase